MPTRYENLPPLDSRVIERGESKVPADYPPVAHKLPIARAAWNSMVRAGEIIIPEGRWSITDHPNRQGQQVSPIYDSDNPMSLDQVNQWHDLGLKTDTAGRPLHPRASELLPTLGMFTQPGAFWGYGPQPIGNLGLRRERNGIVSYAVTAVERGESRLRWGLPGGHAKQGESAHDVAFREMSEETGIVPARLGELAIAEFTTPPQPFWKTTLHAWMEEGYLFANSLEDPGLTGVELEPQDTAEIVAAKWMTLEEIESHPDFLGAHREQLLAYESMLKNRL